MKLCLSVAVIAAACANNSKTAELEARMARIEADRSASRSSGERWWLCHFVGAVPGSKEDTLVTTCGRTHGCKGGECRVVEVCKERGECLASPFAWCGRGHPGDLTSCTFTKEFCEGISNHGPCTLTAP
jgi:hypothetical protein